MRNPADNHGMPKYKQQPTTEPKSPANEDADVGKDSLELDIPRERIGELVEVEGVLVPGVVEGSGEEQPRAEARIKAIGDGAGDECRGGRKCCVKSTRRLLKKWGKLTRGLPEPEIRTSFMGGVVAEWRVGGLVFLEFSRRLKKAWIDVSSPDGDWGMEVLLGRGGWRRLRKKLHRVVGEGN